MKTQHTKGEWELQYVSGVCIGVGTELTDHYFQMIVNTILPDNDEDYETQSKEIEANAKLIAAAPELLEACTRALESIKIYAKDGYIMKGTEAENLLRNAIKKATE